MMNLGVLCKRYRAKEFILHRNFDVGENEMLMWAAWAFHRHEFQRS